MNATIRLTVNGVPAQVVKVAGITVAMQAGRIVRKYE